MNAEDFPPTLRGPWGKLREYAGRLTLILALMYHAADPTTDPLIVPEVGPRLVDDAWRLITYFKSHVRRINAVITKGPGTGGSRAVKAIVDWIQAGSRSSFTEHEFKQARRWVTDEDLADALEYLADRNAIRPCPATPTGAKKGGRPPLPAYEVNPLMLVTQNP
jgi:hypothetical protein